MEKKLQSIYKNEDSAINHVIKSQNEAMKKYGINKLTDDEKNTMAKLMKNAIKQNNLKILSKNQDLNEKHVEKLKQCTQLHNVMERLKNIADRYEKAVENMSEHDLGKNIFRFAGHNFIVDHDANNYIIPYEDEKDAIYSKNGIVKINEEFKGARRYAYNKCPTSAGEY